MSKTVEIARRDSHIILSKNIITDFVVSSPVISCMFSAMLFISDKTHPKTTARGILATTLASNSLAIVHARAYTTKARIDAKISLITLAVIPLESLLLVLSLGSFLKYHDITSRTDSKANATRSTAKTGSQKV
jgi:hypothetical protein